MIKKETQEREGERYIEMENLDRITESEKRHKIGKSNTTR